VCGRCGGRRAGASRGCAGCAPEVRRGRHRGAPRSGSSNGQGLRGWKSAYGAGFQPRGSPVGLPWFEMVAIRPFGTTQAPGRRTRDGDAGNSTLPPVLCNTDLRAAWITRPMARVIHAARSRPPAPGPVRVLQGRECDVPGIFVTDPAEVWRLPDRILTEVRLRDVPVTPLPRTPHVLGSSWGSQPARTPMRSPGPSSDGRPPPEPPPAQAPASHN